MAECWNFYFVPTSRKLKIQYLRDEHSKINCWKMINDIEMNCQ